MLDKCSTTELHPQPGKSFLCFRKVSCERCFSLAFTFCCYNKQQMFGVPTVYGEQCTRDRVEISHKEVSLPLPLWEVSTQQALSSIHP